MNSKLWFEEPDELVAAMDDFTPCDYCPEPNGCLTRCGIKNDSDPNKNVAETPEQLGVPA